MPGPSEQAVAFDTALQLHIQGRVTEAETAYRELLATAPDAFRVYHLLGRLLHEQNRSDEAIECLRSSLGISPDDSQVINDLALVLQETGNLNESAACFQHLIEINPGNAQAWNNHGVVLKDTGHLEKAIAAFQKAASLDPENVDSRANLGNAYKSSGQLAESETAYREALSIDPTRLHLYPNLAAVLRRRNRLDQAAQILAQWLHHEPDNPIARHLHATCTAENPPSRAPAEYVRQVFDEFAETFDEHLKELDTQSRQLVEQALTANRLMESTPMNILDAGCGSGLCASLLKPMASTLTGVDLSSQMLERAKALGLYDDLVEAELVEHLESRPSAFDLIVVADTFGYFGDLLPPLAAARRGLSSRGFLICTIETDEQSPENTQGYRLMTTGRYCHTRKYLENALATANLVAADITTGMLRREAGQPVSCVVVTARPGNA